MNLWKSKKRKEEEEESRRRWQREDEYWTREREEEERRWKEFAEKYGVDRDEAEYQFTSGLILWNPRGSKQQQKLTPGHVGTIRTVRRNTGERAAAEPYDVTEVRFKWIEEVKRIEGKENANVFTSGASGAGKSSLVRLLLRKFGEGQKKTVIIIIFSFKVNDTHLRIGYPVADVSELALNPFADIEAFVSAFAIAFPVSTIGVTASQIPSLLQELAYGCTSWKDFNRSIERRIRDTRDRVQLSALFFIQEQAKSLQQRAAGQQKKRIDLAGLALERNLNLVLDFSRLSDSAKTFHAELLLRGIWNGMHREPTAETPRARVIIYVDEAHRLTRGTFEKYHSILSEMAREIRERGALWTSTQNYTDIEDGIRNQFATQYVFATSSKADLEALKTVDAVLSWVVSGLPKHHFVDAKSKSVHEEVAVYTFGPDGKTDVQPQPLEESLVEETDSPSHADDLDYFEKVRDALAREGVTWISRLASRLNQENGVDKDAAKLKVRNVLLKLLEAGEVQVQRLDDPESGEMVSLYFDKGSDENEGPLHRWMVGKIVESCEEYDIKHVASSGEALPDVETESEYIEAETGLKRRTDDLEGRVGRFGQTKPVVIVVPNEDVAKAYSKKLAAASDRVTVKTLREFLQENARP